MRIEVDHTVCQLYANCIVEAPENFDLDDDGQLIVTADVHDGQEDDVRRAQQLCPVKAITLLQ
jgi:ferredoxin